MTFHNFDFRKEINENICSFRHALQMLDTPFFLDICTRHMTSFKIIDLDVCTNLDTQVKFNFQTINN